MPRTMVQRLIKSVLPANTMLQRDAVTALNKSATVFISHVASAAADHCATANRRIINPNDVFAALRETEHEAMVDRLERELARWVEANTTKRNEYRKKVKETKDGGKDGGADDAEAKDGESESRKGPKTASGADRAAKRVKGPDGELLADPDADDEDAMEVDVDEDEEEEDDAAEDDDEEEEDEEQDEEGDAEDEDVEDLDPAAAQLERESRAVNAEESEEDSD